MICYKYKQNKYIPVYKQMNKQAKKNLQLTSKNNNTVLAIFFSIQFIKFTLVTLNVVSLQLPNGPYLFCLRNIHPPL